MPAEDALLEVPRSMRVVFQHVYIVIGFQQQHLGLTHAIGNQPGAMAKVGQETDLYRRRVKRKSHGINGIVRDRKCVHHKISDFKTVAGFEKLKIKSAVVVVPNLPGGVAVTVHRDAKLGGEHFEPGDVVGMFMRDQNAIESLRRTVQFKQASPDSFGAEATVDEYTRTRRFQI